MPGDRPLGLGVQVTVPDRVVGRVRHDHVEALARDGRRWRAQVAERDRQAVAEAALHGVAVRQGGQLRLDLETKPAGGSAD
ncbi:MAG: hypothetical protein M5U09_18805 [Gammaproteobacteria bacterium]|nr:hypothetical protein [Gammaproteobacteria bacterium]